MSRRIKPNPVTMEDVARAAGVSRMTVSRALRNDGTVSIKTREANDEWTRERNTRVVQS